MAACPSCGTRERRGSEVLLGVRCGPPRGRPAREARKAVTVLFCDVTGSTELGEHLDPAATEMREALADLNSELEAELGIRIVVRTGINTGEVVAGERGGDQRLVTGDAVNTAPGSSRLRVRARS